MKTKYTIAFLLAFLTIMPMAVAQKKSKAAQPVKDNTVVFYIARHGRTMLNTLDRVQGWSDTPLTPEGVKVAEYLGVGLKDVNFKAAYSSDLGRARQTARLVLDWKGDKTMPITETDQLRETCFGSYEGDLNSKMWGDAAIYWRYASLEEFMDKVIKVKGVEDMLLAAKVLDKLNMAETYADVRTRTQAKLREIAEKEALSGGGNVLVVGHGMAIGTMLSNITGEEKAFGHMGNASVCKVIYKDGKFTIESYGDLSYVDKGKELMQQQ